jgi:hypothetical protein
MNIERGFRRLTIALSVAVISVGLSVDSALFNPMETVRIHVRDGRSVEIYPAYGWRRSAKLEEYASIVNTLAPAPTLVKAADIQQVEVVRNVFREWWADARFTQAALILLPLMWIVFFGVRWIVRGFA